MAKKEYVFEHAYDSATGMQKIRPVLDKFARGFKLDLAQQGPAQYLLSTSGVQAVIDVMDNKVVANIELNMMMEAMFRKMLESTLEEKLRPAIDKM